MGRTEVREASSLLFYCSPAFNTGMILQAMGDGGGWV